MNKRKYATLWNSENFEKRAKELIKYMLCKKQKKIILCVKQLD